MATKYLPTADGGCLVKSAATAAPNDGTPVATSTVAPAAAAEAATPDTSATNPSKAQSAKIITTQPIAIEETAGAAAADNKGNSGKTAATTTTITTTKQPTPTATAPAATGATGQAKKKRTSVFRRRLRRRGQREEPTLTRLAAVLGQIKEACMEEEVGPKVAPLIESATRMIEALSENQKQQQGTPTAAASRSKSDGATAETSEEAGAVSPVKSMPSKVESVRQERKTMPGGGVVAGSKIPPHIYRPRMWHTSPMNHQEKTLPYINTNRLAPTPMTAASKEAIQMDQMKLQIRTRLRSATTADDFQGIAAEAERLGMNHEATAARNHIAKLKAK